MDRNRKDKIFARYGELFVKTRTALKLNSICACELLKASWRVRYIRPLRRYERYSASGTWTVLDEDTVINRIRALVLSIAVDYDRTQVNAALTYSVLAGVAKIFRCEVGIENFPLPPCRFIHLQDHLLVFDKANQRFAAVPFSPEFNSRNRIPRS